MNGVESLMYFNTNSSSGGDPNVPDIEMMQAFSTVAFDSGSGTRLGLGLTKTLYEDVFAPLENLRAFLFLPMLLHPKSRGFMKIRSKDPFRHPEFYPNFLSHDNDVQAFLKAIRMGIEIGQQEEFQKLGVSLYMPTIRGCEGTVKGTEDYWRCYIKYLSFPLHHQVATCRMGQDAQSVVDNQLKVHGFENLRVADTSIIPESPSGHTNAYSLMIGEKAADLILNSWRENSNKIRSTRNHRLTRHRRSQFDWQKDDSVQESQSEKSPFWEIFQEVTTEIESAESSSIATEASDLKFILRPDTEDYKNLSDKNTMEMIMKDFPSADEDSIKSISLPDGVVYGKGQGHPRAISEALDQATTTFFDDKDLSIDNETYITRLIPKKTKRSFDSLNQEDVYDFRKILSNTWKATNDGIYQMSEFFRKFIDPGKDREW